MFDSRIPLSASQQFVFDFFPLQILFREVHKWQYMKSIKIETILTWFPSISPFTDFCLLRVESLMSLFAIRFLITASQVEV